MSTLELALVLPILLLLLFGIIEFSRALSIKLQLTYAARDAARAVALQDDGNVGGGLLDLDDLVKDTVEGTLGLVGTVVDDVKSCDTSDDALVELRRDFQPVPPIDALVGTVPIRARGVMPCGG